MTCIDLAWPTVSPFLESRIQGQMQSHFGLNLASHTATLHLVVRRFFHVSLLGIPEPPEILTFSFFFSDGYETQNQVICSVMIYLCFKIKIDSRPK